MDKISQGRATRAAKIEEIKARFAENQGGVLADYRGLDVAQITELRTRFREQNVTFHVVKNTLTSKAVHGTSYEGLDELLSGPTAIAFSREDAIAAARVAVDFAKEFSEFSVKGGFMEGGILSAADVAELSRLGGKKELLAQVLSVFNAPTQKFLGAINGVPQKFLGVLEAREKQLEQGA